MNPPCEVMAKVALPAFRSLVARRLATQYGMPQVEIARMLGITQPSISFYLSSRRGKWIEELERNPRVGELADMAAAIIARGDGNCEEELEGIFCQVCMAIRSTGELDEMRSALRGGGNIMRNVNSARGRR